MEGGKTMLEHRMWNGHKPWEPRPAWSCLGKRNVSLEKARRSREKRNNGGRDTAKHSVPASGCFVFGGFNVLFGGEIWTCSDQFCNRLPHISNISAESIEFVFNPREAFGYILLHVLHRNTDKRKLNPEKPPAGKSPFGRVILIALSVALPTPQKSPSPQ